MSRFIPKSVDLKKLRSLAAQYERARRRMAKSSVAYVNCPNEPEDELAQARHEFERQAAYADERAHVFARATAQWLRMTDPEREGTP